ncbi:9782_t:CDS:2 [Cetraspora pellucida]|uniref:9782_t:CDS:1 n=1 Tax=Cetraspora pellucida TaxID=1433469 RepID=A0A9N9IN93_9GLOM|nr:9782_t:CDS:2 [Cetraspora pellucida]
MNIKLFTLFIFLAVLCVISHEVIAKECAKDKKCRNKYCSDQQTCCNKDCTNTNSDSKNCGTCGNACALGQICQSGTCVSGCNVDADCPSGQLLNATNYPYPATGMCVSNNCYLCLPCHAQYFCSQVSATCISQGCPNNADACTCCAFGTPQ